MGKSVKKNYIYNLIYQIFLLIVPILVTPYIARVLGEDGSGQYSFAFSIMSYFLLFAQLGFSFYGQREIAKFQDDVTSRSYIFWEVVVVRLIPVLITSIVYIALILFNVYGVKYTTLMWILGINVVAILFDVSFFFQGMEEFGKIVLRNVVVKVLSIVAIFLLVKSESDLWIYALIQMGSILLTNIFLWSGLRKFLVKIDFKKLRPFKHLKATIILFLPTIATAVYGLLDKTMIGLITGIDAENGNYEYAEKLVKMALTVITSLGIVLTSSNAKKLKDGDFEGVRNNIYNSTKFVFCLGIPLTLGCILIADNFIPWYLGEGYDKAATLMKLLSPIILLIGLSNVFGLQYLVPADREKQYFIAVLVGAGVNLVLNIILIYFFQSYGAALATLIAEFFVSLVMLFFIRKEIKVSRLFIGIWKYLIAGIIMFVPCYFVAKYMPLGILNTVVTVIVGVILYAVSIILLRDEFVLNIIKKLIAKLKKKENVKEKEEI